MNSRPYDDGMMDGWVFASRALPRGDSDTVWRDGILTLTRAPNSETLFGMLVEGVADFEIDLQARAMGIDNRCGASPETLRHLLLDQIWPRIQAHQGRFVIHGAGVVVNGQGLLLVGASGAGKSTLAASLYRAGHDLLGDDAMLLSPATSGWTMRAVYRSLRLSAEAADQVVERGAPRSPVADYIEKWNVELPAFAIAGDIAVRAVMLLDPAPAESIRIDPIAGAVGAFALLEQSFALDPGDAAQAAARMRMAARLADDVPLFELAYARDYGLIPRVHDAITTAIAGVAS